MKSIKQLIQSETPILRAFHAKLDLLEPLNMCMAHVAHLSIPVDEEFNTIVDDLESAGAPFAYSREKQVLLIRSGENSATVFAQHREHIYEALILLGKLLMTESKGNFNLLSQN